MTQSWLNKLLMIILLLQRLSIMKTLKINGIPYSSRESGIDRLVRKYNWTINEVNKISYFYRLDFLAIASLESDCGLTCSASAMHLGGDWFVSRPKQRHS